MSPTELTLQLPDSHIAARAWGPQDAPPVLAIHGWQDNAASFDLLAPLLPDLRIVAIDLPGHGWSDWRPAGVAYTFLDWVVAARDAIAALGWSSGAILAHSLGGAIANALAASWPESVSRLVLIDGFSPRTQAPGDAPERLRDFVLRRESLRARSPSVYADREAAARRLSSVPHGPSLPAARILMSRGVRDVEGGVTWCRDPRIMAGPPIRLSDEQMYAYLGAVQCPVRLVRPDGYWPMHEGSFERLCAAIPQIDIVDVPGSHHVHLDDPQTVAAAIGEFLRVSRTG